MPAWKKTPELLAVVALACLGLAGGCSGGDLLAEGEKTVLRVEGSDTMVNVAQAWAEQYRKTHPTVDIHVLGGGSGVGIASLIDGNCDVANASRQMTAKEIDSLAAKRELKAVEHVVGYDALAVYVHKDNPVETICLEDLAEIFGDQPTLTRWSQLDIEIPGARRDRILRVSRQNSSGTYAFFREAVLGKKRDMGLGSLDANGSKDAVALVSRTPLAIGYTGMGYLTKDVRVVRVARRRGNPGVLPTVENANNNTYPLKRPLLIYTAGTDAGPLQEYLDWIRGDDGQRVLLELGYVPLLGTGESVGGGLSIVLLTLRVRFCRFGLTRRACESL